jgi:hypothetical protein
MFLIQIDMRGANDFFEVLPDEIENAEFTVEDLASQVLLEHFDRVVIDEVTIDFLPRAPMGQLYCSIFIRAHCSGKASSLSLGELENMELVVEEKISSALVELLGTVHVEQVTINSSTYEDVTS